MPNDKGKGILRELREDVGSKNQLKKNAQKAAAQAANHARELADIGNEDAFVQQIKAAFPKISKTELLEKIALFRELKRIRSGL